MADKMSGWQKNAKDTHRDLKGIDPEKATKEQFLLYGASLAILDHAAPDMPATATESAAGTVTPPAPKIAPQEPPEPPQAIDYVPHSLIDEHLQEMLLHFTSYMQNKSLEQLHNSRTHGEYACNELRKMLASQEAIAVDLFRAADEEEREYIQQSYEKILASLLA